MRIGLCQTNGALVDREVAAGWYHIDPVRLDLAALTSLLDRQPGMLRQQIDHHARMIGIEMLNENEGHSTLWWNSLKDLPEGVQAACRGTNSDDRKFLLPFIPAPFPLTTLLRL